MGPEDSFGTTESLLLLQVLKPGDSLPVLRSDRGWLVDEGVVEDFPAECETSVSSAACLSLRRRPTKGYRKF